MAKRNKQKAPPKATSAPLPIKKPAPRGLVAFLSRYIPFLQQGPVITKKESDTVIQKRAVLAKKKASQRKKTKRAVRVRDVSSSIKGKFVSAPSREPAAVPIADRTHGLRRLELPPRPTVPDIQDDAHEEGIGGFFRHLFVRHPSEPEPEPNTPAIALMKEAKESVLPSLSLDLDTLLTDEPSAQTPKKEASKKKEVAPPLPPIENVALTPAAPTLEKALPTADLLQPETAGAETKSGRFVTKREQEDAKRKEKEAGMKEAVEAKKEKAAREKAEADKKAAEEKKKPKEIEKVPELILPVRVKQGQSGLRDFLGALKYFGLGKERNNIVQNLATMLNAGLPLVDAIRTLQAEARVKPLKRLIQTIGDAVENGTPLWRAMEERHFFSPHAIALIRIGEEAGNLAENMEYLAVQQEKDQALRNKVKMAMIYPTIVLTIMFIIVIGLGWFVLPNLISVLYSLNVPLPLVTRIVIAFTNLFTNYGTVMVPGMLGGLLALILLGKFTPLRVVAQWIQFRIPGMGKLAKEATIARFGVILGGLLQAGVPLIDALRSLEEVTPTVSYRKFYKKLMEQINVGNSFSKSFQLIRGSSKLLPISVQQLVVTGEKSGSLAKILLKIADIYEKKANDTAQKLPVVLEPILLLFIGGLVATIALAIIVPIYSIVGNVGH